MKLFEITIGKYSLTLTKVHGRKEYMKWYQRKHKERIQAQRRKNYKENLNGQRDKKLKYAKKKK